MKEYNLYADIGTLALFWIFGLGTGIVGHMLYLTIRNITKAK